ncbi:glycosyltransferase [Sabulilitoribacter multivorans]|uniref:Glycosyltransferase n=1 Tax=Flaviramulus multivorans TaxID=1304750 RepID=A0ABS9IIP1_9FLAO|nr:glycosyltransferase [Flaviramulus multivorans]MCF7560421.1 glycosyltransferase [Flaviramulus multivorans]
MAIFSVIIPLYNKESYIEATLNSILNQTFDDFEIIIVDDGSTDNSLNVVKSIKSSKITIFEQKNQGASVARNFGVKQAKSKYIALIDADDIWYPNHLFELKKQIDLFPNVGLYCNNYVVFHDENFCKKATFNFRYNTECLVIEDYFKASLINSVAWTSAIGFSKEAFKTLGGFNTNYKTAQDLDLWIRFALNYEVSFNPTVTMRYNFYVDNSLSKKEKDYNYIRYDFINSYNKEELSNPSLKKYLDINRYALVLRCKMTNDKELYKKLQKEIDYSNLNVKQKLLIRFPKMLLKYIKKFQDFLKIRKIYLTAYS